MSARLHSIAVLMTIIFTSVTYNSYSQRSFFDQYDNIEPVNSRANTTVEGWQNFYFSKEDCKCVYDGTFYVAVKTAASSSKNLIVSLQGGGACWPGMIQCKPSVGDEDVQISNFTDQLDERLATDWNQVVIPYCDGSVYMGDTQRDYNKDEKTDHSHFGLRNSVAALQLTKQKFPDAAKIFLTGCSAGGYGTIIQLRLLRNLYPDASIYVLNESGPGLFRPEPDFWKMIDEAWNLKQITPKNCKACAGQLIYWYEEMLEDPKIKISPYSSYNDQVIGQAFLNMTPEAYKNLLLKNTGALNKKYPNQFKRFFIEGNSHCVQDRDYSVEGVKYWDWVLAFVNDGKEWQDLME